jgi:NAD(P)-dependent dehydrogenase (short-subunit alcohol dehydrogenase family)
VAVVTGAARGVGAAIVQAFAREGAAVVAVDLRAIELGAVVDSASAEGCRVRAAVEDVSTELGNARAVEIALAGFGGVDVFVANAAIQRLASLADTSERIWDEVLAVNLKGAYLGARAAIPAMQKRGGGSILFISSVLGIVGDAMLPAYGASKGGLRALARSIAVAHGPDLIRCNTIVPGDIKTRLFEEYIAQSPDPDGALDKILSEYPLGRITTPEDIAQAALFLASRESACITGTDLIIDAGLLAKCY